MVPLGEEPGRIQGLGLRGLRAWGLRLRGFVRVLGLRGFIRV